MVNDKHKIFYNTVLCQTLSECGKFLFAGNNFGDIFVFGISQICAESFDEDKLNIKNGTVKSCTQPIKVFRASENSQILSLAFYNNFLIVGTNAFITGYRWHKNQLEEKKSWEIHIPATSKNCRNQQNEINCISIIGDQICVGCGDTNIYIVNLDNGKIERTLDGHTDYIHALHASDNRLFSASQDGTVRFWDARQRRSNGKLEPFKNDKIARPQFGKWLGTVSVSNDWLVCGGGPKPSLWNLRWLECTTEFPFHKKVRVSGFVEEILYVAGDHNGLMQFNLNGELKAELATSACSIFTVVAQQSPTEIISIGGTSNNLDICTNLNYKDTVLKLYDSQKA